MVELVNNIPIALSIVLMIFCIIDMCSMLNSKCFEVHTEEDIHKLINFLLSVVLFVMLLFILYINFYQI